MGFLDKLKSGTSLVLDPGDLYGYRSGEAAKTQFEAQQKAIEANRGYAQELQDYLDEQQAAGRADIMGSAAMSADALAGGYAASERGYTAAGNELRGGAASALGDLAYGYGQARSDLMPLTDLQGYGTSSTQSVGGGARTASVLGDLGRPVDLESDPGYAYRLKAGEEAINRAAAASGGRFSGATLRDLTRYSSDLASQEYGAAFSRQQATDAQRLGAAATVDTLRQQGNLAAQQNQQQLAAMGYGAQSSLGNLAYQYGANAGNINAATGSNLANLYAARGAAGERYGSALGGLYSDTGSKLANLGLAGTGTRLGLTTALMGAEQNYAQYPGMVQQARVNAQQRGVAAVGSLAASYFGGNTSLLSTPTGGDGEGGSLTSPPQQQTYSV